MVVACKKPAHVTETTDSLVARYRSVDKGGAQGSESSAAGCAQAHLSASVLSTILIVLDPDPGQTESGVCH
jgi:hypothetical protein